MKMVVVLFLLVLTLAVDAQESDTGGAAAAAAAAPGETTAAATTMAVGEQLKVDTKKVQEDFCNTVCQAKKEPALKSACLEACADSQRTTSVLIEGVVCMAACAQPAAAATTTRAACEEACNKEYKAKAAEATAVCIAACSKAEKEPLRMEACKKQCTLPPTV